MAKQELACCFDYNGDALYKQIDDCGLGFVDFKALKRFLGKCGTVVTNEVLVAIIRRLDLDADAKLTSQEFFEGVVP